MTAVESRALRRAAAVLVTVSAFRLAVEAHRGEPIFTPDSSGVLAGLAEATAEATEDRERRERPLGPEERLDPNRASPADLDRLPGIGPATAAEIVRERATRGAFRSAEELMRVRGIGRATLTRIRPHLELGPIPRALARTGASESAPGTARDRALIDVNHADEAALQALPGIGPAIARRIIEHRTRHGPFRKPEDLLAVRGIGPATLADLTPLLTLRR